MNVPVVAEPLRSIPRIAFEPVAMGAVRLPMMLFDAVTAVLVVPDVSDIPVTTEPATDPFRSQILFLETEAVNAPMARPVTVVPAELIPLIVFPATVIVA